MQKVKEIRVMGIGFYYKTSIFVITSSAQSEEYKS